MQKKSLLGQVLFWAIVLVDLTGCAQVGQLQGGKKDEVPPGIDTTRSSKSYQTKVEKANFQLAYDEWIKLDDPINKITVSPPLRYRPTVTLSGRTVNFAFDKREVLRKDATYHINFGEAIKDLNEGNIAKENEFVFSTGAIIDTLSQAFLALDVLTGEPLEKVNILIHENLADSALVKDLPFYMGITDKTGSCVIKNMRPGTYNYFALADKNQNLRFDLPTESLAFSEAAFKFDKSGQAPIILKLSQERPGTKIVAKEFLHDGKVKIVYNQRPIAESIGTMPQTKTYIERQLDSTFVYFAPDTTAFSILVQADQLKDTLSLKRLLKKNLVIPKLAFETAPVSFAQTILPNKPIEILFNTPISAVNQDSLFLYADTLRKKRLMPRIEIDSHLRKSLRLYYPYQDKNNYLLVMRRNAVVDYFQRMNDTIFEQKYVAADKQEFAALALQIDSLQPENNYIISLLSSDKTELYKHELSGKTQFLHTYEGLKVEEYFIKIVEDRNHNHQWDPAKYSNKQTPEYIYLQKAEGLRANFTIEKTIEYSTKNLSEPTLNKRQGIKN